MRETLVLLVVGLTPRLLGPHTPHLTALAARGAVRPLATVLPAVTCTVQSTLLTGCLPREHGIVANGWYFRDLAEVALWRQSNRLVGGEKLWEAGAAARSGLHLRQHVLVVQHVRHRRTWSATPRPMYPADGRKIPDHYAEPPALHDELDRLARPVSRCSVLGARRRPRFLSRWIARATAACATSTRKPTLTLCYLPHLDYGLQNFGPDPAIRALQSDLQEVDALCGELIAAAERAGARVIVVSEYGIMPVRDAVHINRALRRGRPGRGCATSMGRELLDAGASEAFAVADHQLAHVYLQHGADAAAVKTPARGRGRGRAGARRGRQARGRARSSALGRAGGAVRSRPLVQLLLVARRRAGTRLCAHGRYPPQAGLRPDGAVLRPGDPLAQARDRLAARQAQARASARSSTSSRSTTRTLVKGSHGLITDDPAAGPLVISSEAELLPEGSVAATGFKELVLDHVFAA